MARYRFGAGVSDWVFDIEMPDPESENPTASVELASNTELIFFDDEGAAITDLLDENESAVTSVTTDEDGRLPLFYGPDEVTFMWAGTESPEFIVRTIEIDRSIPERIDSIIGELEELDELSNRVSSLENYNSGTLQPFRSTNESLIASMEDQVETLTNEFPKRGQLVLYAVKDSLQSVANNTDNIYVSWSRAPVNEGVWSAGNPTVINLPWRGLYEISGVIWFTGNTGGTNRRADIINSSGTILRSTRAVCGSQSLAVSVNMSRILMESDGTTEYRIGAYQNTGSSVNTPASNSNPIFFNSVCVIYKGPLPSDG